MKNYYNKYKDMPLETLEYEVLQACEDGDLNALKYLLTSKELSINPSPQCCSDTGLHNACEKGYLEIVKYLLTSPELKEHADIHSSDDWALQGACEYNHLEIIKYLLTSTELKEHANMYADDSRVFHIACNNATKNGNFEIIDFFIRSPELKHHIDIHFFKDTFFNNAIFYKRLDLIKYFIFELNIQKTEDIELSLQCGYLDGVDKLFEIRAMNKELNAELVVDNHIQNKKAKL